MRTIEVSINAKEILNRLNEAGYEAFLVGGLVRDALLGKKTDDYDITTSATPNEVKSLFNDKRVIETGIKHGTVTVLSNGDSFEITTYRSDGEYLDSRHPSSVSFSKSLNEDLKRRDFTINALCADASGEVKDYFNGISDLENGIIRTIGCARERFSEDALRILRAVRFSSSLGFKIEESTRLAMIECKSLLSKISKERIATEINRTLCAKNAKSTLLENYEIFAEIIPEIMQMKGFEQKTKYHVYDVLEHTANVIDNTPETLTLRLAALLHDTGKVYSLTMDENGTGHFFGHAEKSLVIAKKYLDEYKYDNFTRDRVLQLIKYHDYKFKSDRVSIKHYLSTYGKDLFLELLELEIADKLSQNPALQTANMFFDVRRAALDVLETGECYSLDALAINGNDLISIGFARDNKIGNCLKELLNLVIDEKIPNEREPLLAKAMELK